MNRLAKQTLLLLGAILFSGSVESKTILLNKTFELCIRANAQAQIIRRLDRDTATGIISVSGAKVDYLADPFPDRRRFTNLEPTGVVSPLGEVQRLYYSDGRQAFLLEKHLQRNDSVFVFFRFNPKDVRQERVALALAHSAFSCVVSDVGEQ